MVYRWRPGAHTKTDAQVVGEHLETLRQANGGLTARLVVDDAKASDSPLHDELEWNNARAADEYRLHQARVLMASVVVVMSVDGEKEKTTRAFVVVSEDDVDRYESIQVVLNDATLRQQVLARALRELEAWQKKYDDLEEFAGVRRAITKTKARLP
jgi:hypothetical protein